tara:strand:- start:6836 stop:7951 length:1116 start_codon:yes stop_codon:yes gene_type:complete
MIPVYKPYLPKKTLAYAHDALDSGWLSYRGKYVSLAQEKLCEEFKSKHCLLLGNGTLATHLLAKSLKYKNPNIEKIIAPNNVYVAAWNAFLFDNNNWKLELVDANIDTWNAEYNCKADNKTAILVVHNVGNIVDVTKIKNKFPNSIIVEDSCEGFFGSYSGHRVGTQSLCSSFSFFANKDITCGEGGMFLTSDDDLYEYIKHISSQAQTEKLYIHDALGYNYRITNVQAAILYGQLLILDEIKEKKIKVFDTYQKNLKDVDGITFQKIDPDTKHSKWMVSIRIKNNKTFEFASKYFKKNNIEIRPMFYPASSHKHILNNKNVFIQQETNASILNKECIFLPSYPDLKEKEIIEICNVVKKYKIMCDKSENF